MYWHDHGQWVSTFLTPTAPGFYPLYPSIMMMTTSSASLRESPLSGLSNEEVLLNSFFLLTSHHYQRVGFYKSPAPPCYLCLHVYKFSILLYNLRFWTKSMFDHLSPAGCIDFIISNANFGTIKCT